MRWAAGGRRPTAALRRDGREWASGSEALSRLAGHGNKADVWSSQPLPPQPPSLSREGLARNQPFLGLRKDGRAALRPSNPSQPFTILRGLRRGTCLGHSLVVPPPPFSRVRRRRCLCASASRRPWRGLIEAGRPLRAGQGAPGGPSMLECHPNEVHGLISCTICRELQRPPGFACASGQ